MDVRLMMGDCLERMAEIGAGSVDLIACDLPYQITDCRWDELIPFDLMWQHFDRLLMPRGSAVLTAVQPFTTDLILSNRKNFKYATVWEKTRPSGFLHAKNRPLSAHEDVLIFSKGSAGHSCQSSSRMTYNPQMIDGEPYCKVQRNDRRRNGWGGDGRKQEIDTVSASDGQRYPRSVVKIPNPTPRGIGITQKPVALFEYLIRTYSNEGETVLDCAMGSGTTGVACVNTGRTFIGIERDPAYFDIASKRIETARSSTPLFAAPA